MKNIKVVHLLPIIDEFIKTESSKDKKILTLFIAKQMKESNINMLAEALRYRFPILESVDSSMMEIEHPDEFTTNYKYGGVLFLIQKFITGENYVDLEYTY